MGGMFHEYQRRMAWRRQGSKVVERRVWKVLPLLHAAGGNCGWLGDRQTHLLDLPGGRVKVDEAIPPMVQMVMSP